MIQSCFSCSQSCTHPVLHEQMMHATVQLRPFNQLVCSLHCSSTWLLRIYMLVRVQMGAALPCTTRSASPCCLLLSVLPQDPRMAAHWHC
jgi:hypothetical protein